MSNPQGGTGSSLGLAVGATNLACTGEGQRSVIRPAEVSLQPGLTLTGFVDRVGDPVPMVAADGSAHRPEMLLAEALDGVARISAMAPVSDVAVAVPAHWRGAMTDALRDALRSKPGLARSPLVSDAAAAVTALRSNPGLPSSGVVVLCDFGGSGASITLVDAATDAFIGDTVRVADFSGDQIDQAVLSRVVSEIFNASDADPAGTAMVGSLARLRDECRRAKERLSDETATAIAVSVPGLETTVRMTRMELDALIDEPLAGFTADLVDTLQRNRVPLASVSAVATVGGGARIPLVTQRLSEHLRTTVVTRPQPQLTAAEGVALIARRSQIVETATAMAPAAAPATATVAAAAFGAGGAPSAVGALAWSEVEDDDVMAVATPFERDYQDYTASPVDSRPAVHFQHDESDGRDEQSRSRRRSPVLLFGLAAAAVAVAAVVFGLTAFTHDTPTVPAGSSANIAPAQAPAPAAGPAAVAQQVQAPATDSAGTPEVSQPQQRIVRQQEASADPAPAPAAAPAPEAPAPAPAADPAPAPAPAPEAPAPAPAPQNPAPAPWTPPWTPPWKMGSTNGSGAPPADSGTGSSTGGAGAPSGGTGTGAGGSGGSAGTGGAGSGTGTATGTGADSGAGSGSGGSAKTPPAPGLIPVIQPAP